MAGFLKEIYKYRNTLPYKTNPYIESALDIIEELSGLKEPTAHIIGAFGGVVFEVSNFKLMTVRDVKRSLKARYATHDVLDLKSVLEFTGLDAEEVTFSIDLNADLGISVRDELAKLYSLLRGGEADYLILGGHAYGEYEWVITDLSVSEKYTDGLGVPIYASVDVTMREAVR